MSFIIPSPFKPSLKAIEKIKEKILAAAHCFSFLLYFNVDVNVIINVNISVNVNINVNLNVNVTLIEV